MEDFKTVLDRVLAGVGEMVAERKARGICASGVIAPSGGETVGAEKVAGDSKAVRFSPLPAAFTTDATDPAGRGCGPKTSGGRTDRNL